MKRKNTEVPSNMSKMICSVCGNAFEIESCQHTPFCSRRCQEVDLSRWLGEQYRIPVEGHEDREFSEQDPDEEPS